MNHKLVLHGKTINVCPLDASNIKEYFSIYKRTSGFSKVYEIMPEFWEDTRKRIEGYVAGERGNRARYLIEGIDSLKGYGYIELNYGNPDTPDVDIAILEEYRRNGYAFEAASVLFENIFKSGLVKCIIWNAFLSNKASCRLAEKLGGTIVEGKNLIMEAMHDAELEMKSLENEEIPKTITYEIRKMAFMNGLR